MPVKDRVAPSCEVKFCWDVGSNSARTSFYREELEKHWRCLDQQRESYSESTFAGFEMAYERLLFRIDRCVPIVDERGLSEVLRSIDGVTRLSIESEQLPTN